ncbi:MAG TPA: TolC family protein [Gemmatimonadota bacterium]|nr:TolC family protein [Gemmatimonadota bacterium]
MNIRISSLLGVTATLLLIPGTAVSQELRRVTLEEALDLFERNSRDLRVARAEAAEAVGAARQAVAYPNPTVAAFREPLSDGDRRYSESTLSLSQRLVWPGTRSAAGDAARLTSVSATARFAADSARLEFEVKQAFVDAERAERAEHALLRVTTVFREGDRSAGERYREGDISLYERRRIEAERVRYEARLAEVELEAAAARRRLATLVAPDVDALELAPASAHAALPPDVASAPADSAQFTRRPEIAAAESALASAVASASAVRRQRIPDLTATGGYKTQSDGLDGVIFGLSVDLPLWDRGAGAIDAAEARVAAAESRLALTRRGVRNDVRRAADRYRSTVRRARFLTAEQDEGPDLLEIAGTAYSEGEMELLELLDAAEAHLEAALAASSLRADLWISFYDLERAVGGFDGPINEREDI